MIFLRLGTLFLIFLSFQHLYAQNKLDIPINIRFNNERLGSALEKLQSSTSFAFTYNADELPKNKRITAFFDNKPVLEILHAILSGTGFTYQVRGNYILIVPAPKERGNTGRRTITGHITDARSGAPLAGVNVQIQGAGAGSVTDSAGNFSLTAKTGRDMLAVSDVGYVSRNIRIGENETDLTIKLSVDFRDLNSVTVSARRKLNTEAAVLNDRKNAGIVSDGISARNIEKTASITTTQALQRVEGVTITDDKYVAIRGLGDRSVIAELNGARLSSSDPDRSSVPLDLIPASFLDNITVYKTLSPDHPADASAGIVELKTLSIPDSLTVRFIAQGGVNSTIGLGGSFNSFRNSDLGFLGQNINNHNLPADFLNLGKQYPGGLQQIQRLFIESRNNPVLTAEANRINRIMLSFDPVLPTSYKPAQPNQIYTVIFGNSFKIFGNHSLGIIISGNYYHRTEDRYHAVLNQYSLYQGVVTGSDKIYNALRIPSFITPEFPRLGKYLNYQENSGTETLNYGLLTGLTCRFNPRNEIQLQYISTRGAEAQGSNLTGAFQNTGLSFPVYNVVNQLKLAYRVFNTVNFQGEHTLWAGLQAPRLSYNLSASKSSENDPDFRFTDLADLRISRYQDPNGVGVVSDVYAFVVGSVHGIGPNGVIGADPNGRKYRQLDENNYNIRVDLSTPFSIGGRRQLLKVGYNYLQRDRTFRENILGLPGTNIGGDNGLLDQVRGNLDQLVSYNNIGLQSPASYDQEGQPRIGGFLYQIKKSPDNYTGNYKTQAFYVMLDSRISAHLRLIGGVRFESTDIHANVDTANVYNPLANIQALNAQPGSGNTQTITAASTATPDTKYTTGFLPYYSANLVYTIHNNMNFRLAYATSLARPELRELTNIYEFDPFQFAVVIGNPNLVNQQTRSADFRWEWFTAPGEVFSASLFGKLIDHQLTKVFIYHSQGNQSLYPEFPIVEFQNDPNQGKVYGIELEARKNMGGLWGLLHNFFFGANVMLAQSVIDKNPARLDAAKTNDRRAPATSPLFEQAPYSINTYIDYDNPRSGTNITCSFNIVGERLIQVQLDGVPDLYDRPVPILDLVFSQRINKRFLLKGFAKNLLDPAYRQVYANPGNNGKYHGITYLHQEYHRGTEYSLGLTYNLF